LSRSTIKTIKNMETNFSTLNYSTGFVSSLILRNKELNAYELNETYPAISIIQFGINRGKLQKNGLVSPIKVTRRTPKKINLGYALLDNNVTNEEVTNDYVKDLIKLNPTLMPKQLSLKYPHITWQKFNANRVWLNVDDYATKRKENRIEVIRSLVDRKPNAYRQKNKTKKNDVRNVIAKLIYDSGIYGVIPCLPHIDCLGEVAITNLTDKNTYIGVGDDKLVVEAMGLSKELLGLPMECFYGDMFDFLSQYKTTSFAHIIMDFCGVMPKQIKSVAYAIENNLVPIGGYLFLTFQRSVRIAKKGYYAEVFKMFTELKPAYCDSPKSDFANDMLLKMVMADKYELVKEITYQSGVPMIFYAIKRIK
jgi:hypothetical protein